MDGSGNPGRPRERFTPWLAPLLLLAAWQFAAQAGWLSPRVLPAPSAVASAAGSLAASGELWPPVRASLQRALAGLLLGGSAGLLLGILNGASRPAGAWLDGILQTARAVPVLALAPLILWWLGTNEAAGLALLSLSAFFPIYFHAVRGIRAVEPALLEMSRSCGLAGWRLYRDVLLPGALPSILRGSRQALGLVWLVLVALEVFSAPSGIGRLMAQARELARADVLLAGFLLYAVLGRAADALAAALERRLLPWNPARWRPGSSLGMD
jgi:sulfonate transport system permease protein